MISLANYMTTIRRVTFLTTLVFSLIVLSLSAALISLTEPTFYYKFSAFALATSLLSLLTVGPMFVVDLYIKETFFSYIVFEISWLSFLWVLWLSSGSSTAQKDHDLNAGSPEESSCTFPPYSSYSFESAYFHVYDLNKACHEIKAIMAFSFLTWILLMFYTVTLLVLALRAQWQGHNVWETAVRDGALFYPSEKVVGGAPQVVAPQPAVDRSYPPPAQQYISPPPQQYVPPLAQQYIPQSAQQYIPPPAPQYIPQSTQQYIPPPAPQYIPQSAPQYIPSPAQQSPPPLAQQYTPPPAQQYTPPPAQQYTPPPAQQYTPPPAQQYIPPPAQQSLSPPAQQDMPPPAQQSLPTSVSYAYPAQV